MIKSFCPKCYNDIYITVLPFVCSCGFKLEKDKADTLKPVENKNITTIKIFVGEVIEAYREHWKKLHIFAVQNLDQWSINKAKDFLLQWEKDIPIGSCGCKSGWETIKECMDSPTKYDNAESFFRWSVEAHNAVNKKLNKTIVSYEEACKIHGF